MSVLFNKGRYYIGDPCYVINDQHWDELIERTDCFSSESFELKGKTCFAANTAYGDGTYNDEEGREYAVDAGLIGVIPFEALDENFEGNGGQIIDFVEDFTASVENGTFHIGGVTIITSDTENDLENEWDFDAESEELEEPNDCGSDENE